MPIKLLPLIALIFYHAALEASTAGDGGVANPDFTKGDGIPEDAPHDWNLGPTGLRGWMFSHRMDTTEARQVMITEVADNSPAAGLVQVGDVLLGVQSSHFSYDPRTELGKAITRAEATDGQLSLLRWRNGETETTTVNLAVLGNYSPTAPFDCPKSSKILAQASHQLARHMNENPTEGNGIERCFNALALLATGNPDFLPIIRQQVEWAAQYSDLKRKSLHSWFYGPANLLLAEYTLATGDQSFIKDLERVTLEIVAGQSAVGSWGHRFVQDNGRLAGYGMMNAPGLTLTTSLLLAREAGIRNPTLDEAIDKSLDLLRFYSGKGAVPYGDHHPWVETHEDNGKNGIAALAFHLANEPTHASYFSKTSVASHGAERDTGHTGNYFNILWAMPGVALSGPHATGAWLQEFGWYYDLARRWDGSFQHQGPPSPKHDSYKNWDATGAFILAYAQPLANIHLAGRKKSIVKAITASQAASLIADGKGWSPRKKDQVYSNHTTEELLNALKSWSPVVRERAASELAHRDSPPVDKLIDLLRKGDLNTQLGTCQALIALKHLAAPAYQPLVQKLDAEDLWLRIKAAEALASIGQAATPAIPTLLSMIAAGNTSDDPRGMQQRYLTFALFDRREGMLKQSLDGVNRDQLYAAVRAGLKNQDGRARGTLDTVYHNLSFEEIKPLLPAIHEAILHPAPSGIMFADGIRLGGLKLLARHRISEGLPLCLDLIRLEDWGAMRRLPTCLNALQLYGGAAQPLIPKLTQLEQQLQQRRNVDTLDSELKLIRKTIEQIAQAPPQPGLRSLKNLQAQP